MPTTSLLPGNTVVDALTRLSDKLGPGLAPHLAPLLGGASRFVLVTSHRRESWEHGIADICGAVADLARAFPDVAFIYPVHRNPHVQAVFCLLWGRCPMCISRRRWTIPRL